MPVRSRSPRSAAAKERALIIRLITVIGLSLLLTFSVATTVHGEFEDVAVTSSAEHAGSAADTVASEPGGVIIITGSRTDPLGAASGCVLGALCGLLVVLGLLTLLRGLRGRGPSLTLPATPWPSSSAALHPVIRASSISLVGIGVSRT